MNRILTSLLAGLAIASVTSASAIDSRTESRGLLLNQDIMSVAQMGTFANTSFQYGTARSMGMAGAMTSLGGDASSMMINPAGLGMMRSNEISLTPIVTIQSSDTSGANKYLDSNDSSFALSNFTAVINVYESSTSPLVSFNIGFGYNRVSDLNYSYSFASMGNSSTIANLFSRQLTSSGTSINELYGNDNPNWSSFNTQLWGAGLGYKTGMTFQSVGDLPYNGYNDNDQDEPIIESDGSVWSSSWISNDASVDQYMRVLSEGSIGEYDISMGGNIMNKLYFGFTFGVQSLYQRLDLLYNEDYTNAASFNGANELQSTFYNQAIITQGVGVNAKLGVTYRPMEALRIGFAYHTPTYYTLERKYQASMASNSISSSNGVKTAQYIAVDSHILEDVGKDQWKYRTTSRILMGGSYTFAQRALISVDYERAWYGSMKVNSMPTGVESELYSSISDIYQAVNAIRIGGEYKLSPSLAFRAGYGHTSSMLQDGGTSSQLLDMPTTDRVSIYSMGIGYAPNRGISFDLTYMCQTTHMSEYSLFYSEGDISVGDGEYDYLIPSAESAQSQKFTTKLRQHNVALSMTIKM